MTITNKQRKLIWLTIAILAGLYYAPSIIESVRRVTYLREQAALQQQAAERQVVQPQTAKRALPKGQGQADADATTPAPVAAGALSGFWQGASMMPNKNELCSLHLELRDSPQEPGHILGYPSLSCVTFDAAHPGMGALNPALSKFNPTTGILNGTWDKTGSLRFSVVKSLTADGSCPLTGFTLTPFGTSAITVEWQEGTCQNGNMVLRKSST